MIRFLRFLGFFVACWMLCLGITALVIWAFFERDIRQLAVSTIALGIAYRILRHRYFPTRKDRKDG